MPSASFLIAATLFSLLLLKCTLGKLHFWARFTGVFPLRTAFNCMLESNWDWVGLEWCLKRGNIQLRPGSHLQAVTALLHQARPAAEAGLIPLWRLWVDTRNENVDDHPWQARSFDFFDPVRPAPQQHQCGAGRSDHPHSSCTRLSLELSWSAGSGPPDMTMSGPQRGARAVVFGWGVCRMGWDACTGTAWGLLQEGTIQSNPSSSCLFPQRFHRGFMLLTSFS